MPEEDLEQVQPADETVEVEPLEVEATEVAPEPEPEDPKHVPMGRFKEVWDEKQTAKQEAEQLRYQNMLLQQTLIANQQQASRPAPPPPPRAMTREEQELDEILEPFIQRKIAPLVEDYRQKAKLVEEMAAANEANRAMEYVNMNVPDFKELAPDLESWLKAQPKGYQDYVTSHPNNVVLACNMIRAMRGAGGQAVAAQVRNDLKGRSRSESGSSASRPDKTQTYDWANMTDEEFAKADAAVRGRGQGTF